MADNGASSKRRGPSHDFNNSAELYPEAIAGLKELYASSIRPVEEKYGFHDFYSPLLRDADFDAKPMVVCLGQYSVGKTSFIRYLCERDFPSMRIGPEPTTDRFIALMHGDEDLVTPGNAAAIQSDRPFQALQQFGNGFLSKFEVSEMDVPLLERMTIVDTPGVLSGEKQRIGRSYDFPEVIEWFASRADLILCLFDAHKLDISDEFKRTMEALRGNDDKIRIILNKADSVNPQQLMRVYGALMWSLGKVISTPEVVRVYIGSFWEEELQDDSNRLLFEAEEADLMRDLHSLPKYNAIRKVNELVKRARLAKVHALLISHLRNEMPMLWGKDSKKEKLIETLLDQFKTVMRQHRLPPGDFPDLERFRSVLLEMDFTTFAKLDEPILARMDAVLERDIPALMSMLNPAEMASTSGVDLNPFAQPEPADDPWAISAADKAEWDAQFEFLGPDNKGKLAGTTVRPFLLGTGLGQADLYKVWQLADIDADGKLDSDEFAVLMFLVQTVKESGTPLPDTLPPDLVPPSKR